MADEWVGVLNSTAPKYLKGAADLTMRQRLLLAMIQSRGRVKFNESGTKCIWTVQFDEPPVEDYADAAVINYARHDLLRQLEIDWRGYRTSDMMTRKEKEMNKGDVAIVERYKRILPQLATTLRNNFCSELYTDGYATGNENKICGLESFMGAGTVASGDKIAQPSDTYGGHSTALANEGGSWSADLTTKPNSTVATDWPDGSGDARYDFLSPKLLNWSSTAWNGGGSTTWALNCIKVLRQAQTWGRLTGGKEGMTDLALMSGNLHYDFKNAHQSYLQINVPHREANDLGFPDVLNFEGMAINTEFDVPVDTCYFINVDMMELACLTSELFFSVGPEFDPRVDAWLFNMGFFGNLRFQPKFFGKAKNYA